MLFRSVDTLPPLPRDTGDRNRTSPFAFTGNRFEFRAVGSTQSIAGPLVALNTIMAESLDYIATEIETATDGDDSKFNEAVQTVLKQIVNDHGAIIFNGDNYTDEWEAEAAERGLLNLRTTPEALPQIVAEQTVETFETYNVLSKAELKSRYETYLEQYALAVNVEAQLTLKVGKTQIFPAAIRYQSELAKTCADLKAVGYTFDTDTLDHVTGLVKQLQDSLTALEQAIDADKGGTAADEAEYFRREILPGMTAVRAAADDLERVVADDLWPLPTYQEMLFIK